MENVSNTNFNGEKLRHNINKRIDEVKERISKKIAIAELGNDGSVRNYYSRMNPYIEKLTVAYSFFKDCFRENENDDLICDKICGYLQSNIDEIIEKRNFDIDVYRHIMDDVSTLTNIPFNDKENLTKWKYVGLLPFLEYRFFEDIVKTADSLMDAHSAKINEDESRKVFWTITGLVFCTVLVNDDKTYNVRFFKYYDPDTSYNVYSIIESINKKAEELIEEHKDNTPLDKLNEEIGKIVKTNLLHLEKISEYITEVNNLNLLEVLYVYNVLNLLALAVNDKNYNKDKNINWNEVFENTLKFVVENEIYKKVEY